MCTAEVSGNETVMTYLRVLEPLEWHLPALRRDYFKSLFLPDAMIAIMAGSLKERAITWPDDYDEEVSILFHSLTSTRVVWLARPAVCGSARQSWQ